MDTYTPEEIAEYNDAYNQMLILTFKDGLKLATTVTSDMSREERRRILEGAESVDLNEDDLPDDEVNASINEVLHSPEIVCWLSPDISVHDQLKALGWSGPVGEKS